MHALRRNKILSPKGLSARDDKKKAHAYSQALNFFPDTISHTFPQGEPLYNAVVWLDTRTQSTVERLLSKAGKEGKDALRSTCGLPISTYFSAVKVLIFFGGGN